MSSNSLAVATLAFFVFLLAGCTTPQPFTREDKAASMKPYADMRMTLSSPSLAARGSTVVALESRISGIVKCSTALILNSNDERLDAKKLKNPSDEEGSESVKNENSSFLRIEDFEITNWDVEDGTRGQGVRITEDGYYLTAHHVVEDPVNRVLIGTAISLVSPNQSEKLAFDFTLSPIRIVYSDPTNDFAILKSDIVSRFPFKMRETPLQPDELIFAGGGSNGGLSAGIVLKTTNSKQSSITHIHTSAPAMKGDSGSGVLDREGNLCGIITQFRTRPTRGSNAAMLNPSVINEIIRKDRVAHAKESPLPNS